MALIFLAYWFMIGIPQILAPGSCQKKKSNKIEKRSSRGRPSRRQLDDEGWDADSQASSWESLLLTKLIKTPHIIWSEWNQVSILACAEHKSKTSYIWCKSHDNTFFLWNCSREYSMGILIKRTEESRFQKIGQDMWRHVPGMFSLEVESSGVERWWNWARA